MIEKCFRNGETSFNTIIYLYKLLDGETSFNKIDLLYV